MSTVSTSSSVVTKPKKRKSRAPESVEDHEHPAPKKAKHHQPEPEAIIEVDRIDTTSMAEGNASTALQQMAIDHQDCRIVHGYTRLSLPPLFATDPMEGVEDMLEHLSLRYVGSLGGVLIDYSNITLLHDTARMIEECPFAVVDIEFDATVWCPKIGMRLDGKVNLFSPDHISLLRHDTFNVSIPNSYIPKSEYVFQHYPAENDPEFGAGSSDWHERTGGGQAADGTTGRDEDMVESMGRWVKRSTGERIGGKDGIVDFTVVGMSTANGVISLIGSLQPDPFNPAHFQTNATPITPNPSEPPIAGPSTTQGTKTAKTADNPASTTNPHLKRPLPIEDIDLPDIDELSAKPTSGGGAAPSEVPVDPKEAKRQRKLERAMRREEKAMRREQRTARKAEKAKRKAEHEAAAQPLTTAPPVPPEESPKQPRKRKKVRIQE